MSRQSIFILGIFLAILGMAGLVWQRISYTERETVIDVGAVNITAETEKSIPLPPILGGIALASGVGLIAYGARKPQGL